MMMMMMMMMMVVVVVTVEWRNGLGLGKDVDDDFNDKFLPKLGKKNFSRT